MASATPLKRSSPEAEGIPSSAVLDFVQALEQHTHPLDAIHGFMLLRHGNVAAEGWWTPYGAASPHTLYSLSKSFTSSAIGLAVAEGLLTVDDPVLKFFPDEAPAKPGKNLKAMRVRHLLSMNTGHQEDITRHVFQARGQLDLFGLRPQDRAGANAPVRGSEADNWPRAFLSLPVERKPGTWFVYNTAATYILSAIITKLTGQSLLEYLRPRLLDPLGIENPVWETDPRGINLGGTGLHLKTEDIASFGQMYLQKGLWQGQRILSEQWIAEATRATSDNSNTGATPDWTAGYGYQFWRCRPNCYRGDGAFGQYCIVMPEQDALLVMIGGVRDMQAVLDRVWAHLLPAMQPEALPTAPRLYAELCARLANLALPLPSGGPSSPVATRSWGKTFNLESNELGLESVMVQAGRDGSTLLMMHDERGEHSTQVGYGTWLKGTSTVRGYGDEPVAAAGAWTTEDIYEVRVCYYESELGLVFRFHYAGGKLQLEVEPNVSWGTTTARIINGHADDEAL